MQVAQRADHLEFDDDLVLDQEGGGKFANDHAVVNDDASPLLGDAELGLSHLVGKRVLMDLVNEPMAERIGNRETHPMIRSATGCNNRASPSSICIPLIRLKKKPALASVPTPDRARMAYTASGDEP
jgi:hypothetical protein